MAGAVASIKAALCDPAILTALNARLAVEGLPQVAGPIARHRDALSQGGSLPALAVELGELTARRVGSGLRALNGEATYRLALGAVDQATLLPRLEALVDALRAAVEVVAGEAFQALRFTAALVEGEPVPADGVAVRRLPVQFAFEWLEQDGDDDGDQDDP